MFQICIIWHGAYPSPGDPTLQKGAFLSYYLTSGIPFPVFVCCFYYFFTIIIQKHFENAQDSQYWKESSSKKTYRLSEEEWNKGRVKRTGSPSPSRTDPKTQAARFWPNQPLKFPAPNETSGFFVNLNPHNLGQSLAPNNFVSSKFIVRIEPYRRAASGHTPRSKPLHSATLSVRRAISTFWKSSALSRINTAREVTMSMLNKYSQMPGKMHISAHQAAAQGVWRRWNKVCFTLH